MKFKRSLLGFGLILVGILIINLLPVILPLGFVVTFFGIVFFFGFWDDAIFVDYVTYEDGNYIFSMRKRKYYNFLPFSLVLGLLRTELKFIYRVEYYKFCAPTLDLKDVDIAKCRIAPGQYKALLETQRQQYLNGTAPKELVKDICDPESVELKAAKRRWIVPLVLLIFCATPITLGDPSAILLSLVYCSLLGWLTVLRHLEYKEAQRKATAYARAFPEST